jgi:hypothetical protein
MSEGPAGRRIVLFGATGIVAGRSSWLIASVAWRRRRGAAGRPRAGAARRPGGRRRRASPPPRARRAALRAGRGRGARAALRGERRRPSTRRRSAAGPRPAARERAWPPSCAARCSSAPPARGRSATATRTRARSCSDRGDQRARGREGVAALRARGERPSERRVRRGLRDTTQPTPRSRATSPSAVHPSRDETVRENDSADARARGRHRLPTTSNPTTSWRSRSTSRRLRRRSSCAPNREGGFDAY